jgi:succinate dehydrogenase flavin-adding protein (antitoxin of CptAB toxin-antitoxin module)
MVVQRHKLKILWACWKRGYVHLLLNILSEHDDTFLHMTDKEVMYMSLSQYFDALTEHLQYSTHKYI